MSGKSIHYVFFAVGLTLIGNPLLRGIPGRLGQDWVVTALMSIQPHLLGLPEARTSKLYSTIWELGVPLAIAITLLAALHAVRLKLRHWS
jgi:hypothetical protein